jgi:hypothetical protein
MTSIESNYEPRFLVATRPAKYATNHFLSASKSTKAQSFGAHFLSHIDHTEYNYEIRPAELQYASTTFLTVLIFKVSRTAQSVQRIATGWTVRGSNPGGGEFSRTCPDRRPWGPPSLLYNGYRVFPGGKAAGAWRWPATPPCAEAKERVEIYLYYPYGPSWSVLGWPLPLLLIFKYNTRPKCQVI